LWYNSEVFNWFEANDGGDGTGSDSSGIDDVLNIGNLTIDDIQIREQDDGGAWECERIQFGAPEVLCFHHTNEITFPYIHQWGQDPPLEQDFFAPSPPTAGPSNPQTAQPEQGASVNRVPNNDSSRNLATSIREPAQPGHDDEPKPTPATKAHRSTRKNTAKK
jgi:hypothetical protein